MAFKWNKEKSLAQGYKQYEDIVEFSPLAICVQVNNNIVFLNNAGVKLLNQKNVKYLIGKSVTDFVSPRYRETVMECLQRAHANESEIVSFEADIIRPDGTKVDVEISATPLTYQNKQAIQIVFHEITNRKHMDDQIFQSSSDCEDIFNIITDMITIHDKNFNIIHANKASEKILNLPLLKFNKEVKCFDYYHGKKSLPDGCPICKCLTTGKPANFEIFEPHLNMYIEIRAMPRFNRDNQIIGLIHIIRDVTRRKQAETEIRKAKDELEIRVEQRTSELRITSEQLIKKINEHKQTAEALNRMSFYLDNINDTLIVLNAEREIIEVNREFTNLWGYSSEEILGKPVFKIFPEEDVPKHMSEMKKAVSTKKPRYFETVALAKSGEKVPLSIRGSAFFDKDGKLEGFTGIFRDITERKQAEKVLKESEQQQRITNEQLIKKINEHKQTAEALRKSESKFRSLSQEFNILLDGIPDSLILLSPDLKIKWANTAAYSTFGKTVSELTEQNCYKLCCDLVSPCENCPTLRSFQTGKEENSEYVNPQGRVMDLRAFPTVDDTGKVKNVIELKRDITEKINLHAEAMRTRHLASLGELAAGVAHEINNPINNIINYAQILIDEKKGDDGIKHRIIKDGERIAIIVRSLLSFARIRKEEKENTHLKAILSDMLSLTGALVRKDGITLKLDIPSDLPQINVHAQQMQQVFLNIISNSRFALNTKYPGSHKNKVIQISCKKVTIHNSPYIRIIFHDRGAGIPAHILSKVLNPFFSTKPHIIGTGLGLSISHGIISEHNGKFMIESIEGEFTNIIIDLPSKT